MVSVNTVIKYTMLGIIPFMFSACYSNLIDSGQVGVQINAGVVQENAIGEGFNFSLNPMAELVVYNIKAKQLEMSGPNEKDTVEMTNDGFVNVTIGEGLQIPVDVTMLYALKPTCAPLIRKKYGEDVVWDNKIVIPNAREVVRNVIGRDKGVDIYKLNQNRDKYGNEIQADLQKSINDTIGQECVFVSMVTIKDIHIPQSYAESIMKKNQMEEESRRAELSVKKAEAEAKIEIAKAEGTAKAQLALAKSITPEMIKWKELENATSAIQKWDGKLPTTQAGGTIPFLQVK